MEPHPTDCHDDMMNMASLLDDRPIRVSRDCANNTECGSAGLRHLGYALRAFRFENGPPDPFQTLIPEAALPQTCVTFLDFRGAA